MAIVKRHEPDFAPGEKVVYCDTNYIFLGMIIEKVTGKPVGIDPRRNSWAPRDWRYELSDYFGYARALLSRLLCRRGRQGELRDFTASNPAVAWSAGAMISTLDDLRIWSKALATGALLNPETHAEQMKFGAIATKPIHVGYGLGIANFGGLIGHNGAIFGYTTAMFYVPAADATIVIEGNLASNFSNSATEIAYALAKRLMPDLVE